MTTTLTPVYGSSSSLTVTGLTTLNNSLTSVWQSDVIDNRTAKASDYLILLNATLGSTLANDKAMYVYCVPWYHDGSNLTAGGDTGTTSNNLTSAGAGAGITIAAGANLGSPTAIMNFAVLSQAASIEFRLSQKFGFIIPHEFQLVCQNYGGSALVAASGKITPITYTSV